MKYCIAYILVFWFPASFHYKMVPAKEQKEFYGHNKPLKNFVKERKIITWAWKQLLAK